MKIRMSAILGISILLFLFASCSSLPLPATPTESLFIISGDLERDLGTGQDGNGHTTESLHFSIVNLETGKKKDLTFFPSKNFSSTTLEPGKYAFDSKVTLNIKYKGGNHVNYRTEYIQPAPFLVEESTVFISPVILKVNANRGWYHFSSYYSGSTSNIVKERAMEDVFAERRYKAWELYQLIGWEALEE